MQLQTDSRLSRGFVCSCYSISKMADESDDITTSDDEEQLPPAKKLKTYRQKYNCVWERDPTLKGWLGPVRSDPYKAFCKVCSKDMIAGLSELKKHQKTKKHRDKAAAVKTTRPITEMVVTDTLTEKVQRAEIKIATFVVEHHLPFQIMDHLSDLVTNIFPDSEVAKKFQCKHTKSRCIIKHVVGDHFRSLLVEKLRNTLFSIIIDESTDISSTKLLAIVVRFFCDKGKSVKSQFLKLLKVTKGDATTITLAITS